MSDRNVESARFRPRGPLLAIGLASLALIAGAAAVAVRGPEKFTLIVLPDTQYYIEAFPDLLVDQIDWILAERDTRNILMVLHEGDIVENFDSPEEWERAEAIFRPLRGVVPAAFLPGNHDMSPEGDTESYNRFFPIADFAGSGKWGGFPPGGSENGYHRFTAGGYDFGLFRLGADPFLVLMLEFCPRPEVLTWANQVLREHPESHAIVVTHAYLNTFGQRHIRQPSFGCGPGPENTQYLFDGLIYPNPNVFLVLSGHEYDTQDADGEAYRVDGNVAGRPVHQLLADYQRRPNGGDGWLRILGFNQEIGEVIVRTYSPSIGSYEKDDDSDFRIPYPAPLPEPSGPRP